ncbi:MAG: hypothetical protein ABIE94_01445 [archaeon]
MMETQTGYDYYAEKLVQVMEENQVLDPEEKRDFMRYVRGC